MARSSCKKQNFLCSVACGHFHGTSCLNAAVQSTEIDLSDSEDEAD